ncbi:radical SAM protein [Desulfobaculum bizertense]|uniref:Wyosine [tRNA(Phe)-imidazoG37] synthetase, radical SAM superfamily n=1 Tax=Desulfobaculum bizertense DSM 18034 TaxID=1121442 RepID=A0A1T4VIA5_9BACT|nr:radical SAM protein [Desulfobaculum bizertense]UIJ37904.1 radical SAM protein [Desulfobaculum bizertense]SKA64674.1 Wyosine [tRNA(Phe)-imidazoG37] synthetase, radical SAM superfamily [Desulfobaculum bizertense DSM 18034]
MGYKYVFGPVHSGRLGLSLGLDLVGDAICSLDCIYCEVGKTTCLTTERKAYVPAADILAELADWKTRAPQHPDFVTLGGQGEPTLNSEMGAVIHGVKKLFPNTPVAVLTNSTLFYDEDVRTELLEADVILPSIDTLVPAEMRHVNRQHASLDVHKLTSGLLAFKKQFTGKIYLEVLLVKGVNDSDENRTLLREFIAELRPDRVDVVTMTRPGTMRAASPVSAEQLSLWKKELSSAASADADCQHTVACRNAQDILEDDGETDLENGRELPLPTAMELILNSVSRRPQTAPQLATALEIALHVVDEALLQLEKDNQILFRLEGDDKFFSAVRE